MEPTGDEPLASVRGWDGACGQPKYGFNGKDGLLFLQGVPMMSL